jgi:hypothetical protein
MRPKGCNIVGVSGLTVIARIYTSGLVAAWGALTLVNINTTIASFSHLAFRCEL